MTVLQSLVLGIVQGLSEFLPISSSAHLILVPWLLGWDEGGLTYDVALHLGTLLAVLVYFRADWIHITKTFFKHGFKGKTVDQKMPVYLFLATIPGGVLGLLLEKKAEHDFRNPLVIAITLAVMGVVLWLVDKYSKKSKNLKELTLSDALLIGVAQGFALFPGVSRSGVTILTGLSRGLDRPSAAKFSFLLAMPITLGACVFKLRHLQGSDMTPVFLTGVIASTVFGYLAIDGLIKFLQKRSYGVFAAYRVLVGLVVAGIILLNIHRG